MHEKVVLIGAGSAAFTRGLLADIIRARWTGELALVDTDPQALRVAAGLARKMLAAADAGLKLSASTERTELLPDATVVICTVGVGGRRAWEQDVYVPRRHGIYQPVGDTVMPGGSSRVLRMLPALVDIMKDALRLAPRALLINYSNPMSAVCRGIRKATGADVIGLCHGVPDSVRRLARWLEVPAAEFAYTAVGINHMTWITDLRGPGGVDLTPRLLDLARRHVAVPLTKENFGLVSWLGDTVTVEQEEPFTWRLTELFGAYPVPGDRHITEFHPRLFAGEGKYFGKTLGVDAYSFEGTIAAGDRGYQQMTQRALSAEPLPAAAAGVEGGEHEQVVEIIESIRQNRARRYSVNLPNRGQAPDLPREAVIECPALSGAQGLQPVLLGRLPRGLLGPLATRFEWVETIVDAALEGSRTKFIQALLLDGAVDSLDQAARLADDLLAAQQQYLPQFAC